MSATADSPMFAVLDGHGGLLELPQQSAAFVGGMIGSRQLCETAATSLRFWTISRIT
jgi:hypothetical protein